MAQTPGAPSQRRVRATNASRALYNETITKFKGKIVTPGYLRLESSIQVAALNQITFPVLQNQPPVNQTENRLKLPDAFVIEKIFFGLIKAGAAVAATQAEIAQAKIRANNNALIFVGAAEAANLQAFYNGYISIRVDTTVYIDSMDVMRFYRVSTSQKGVGPAVIITDDEWNAPDFAMYELIPSITIEGSANNVITVSLPASLNLSGTASQNFAVCVCRGFLVQNGAKYNT